jgi:hypothetical protein
MMIRQGDIILTWDQQLELLKNNSQLQNYFFSNNINLQDFLTSYIQVDQIICKSTEPSSSEITVLLKNLLVQNENKNNELVSLFKHVQNDFGTFKTQLESSLRNITNTEIKEIVSQLVNSDKQFIQNNFGDLSDKLINLNSQNLNEYDRKTLGIIQNIQSTFNSSLDTHHITHKINDIDTILTSLHNKFNANSSKKGEYAENILFNNLVKAFPDSDVILTRFESDAADIQIKKENKPLILIDSKHIESKNVPKIDLDKFHENCKLNNASGILCNAFSGIANKKHFEIDIIDKNIIVYIWNHEFDPTLFQIASRIIYNIHNIIKEQKTDKIQIDQILYKKLKLEYNFFLQNFQQHLNVIKTNIKSLEQLSLNQLEQFFKRTNFDTGDKEFQCSYCCTGFKAEKYLKDHIKKIHNITLTTSKRGRKKKVVEPPIEKVIEEENTEGEEVEEEEPEDELQEEIEEEPVNIIRF